jgi:large subunit ribosomal protein L15
MQTKRSKRSRIRAAKPTSGHGHKKKNRGAGHRGGRGESGSGKRGDFKLMKLTKGGKRYLGKHGFVSLKKNITTVNLSELQIRLESLVKEGKVFLSKDIYEIDLEKLGFKKLLSKGNVFCKMNIKTEFATPKSIKKVEEKGGKVILPEKNA